MKLVYMSRTGNVQSFVEKTGIADTFEIENGNEKVNEKFVLVTFTDGYGDLPEEVATFLSNNAEHLVAVAASGDMSYDEAYCLAADVVADTYGVPIIGKFEFDGTDEDVSNFLNEFSKF